MDAIVGYTGFVGSNLARSHPFGASFNSSNIKEAFGLKPDLLVFAALRAEKYIANRNPAADLESIETAKKNIEAIGPSRLALISTIDVYPNPRGVDEDSEIEEGLTEPYGANRRLFEKWAMDSFPRCHIFRLPALYGINLRKNFIFDMMNRAPSLLTHAKLSELSAADASISGYYGPEEGGFHRRIDLGPEQSEGLLLSLRKAGFSSLNFTDYRARFQFYNLGFLWNHIGTAISNDIKILNLATEPITAGELYRHIYKDEFTNVTSSKVPDYDFLSKYAGLFGGSRGYLLDKAFLLNDIKGFVEGRLL